MANDEVTEQEIEAAMKLSARRDFSASLDMYYEMLPRAQDQVTKMRVLFGIVTCSTWLNLDDIRNDAIDELNRFPDQEISNGFAVMVQAEALIEFGRAREALDLIDLNLSSELLRREDFQDWKYEHLADKGRALAYLQRWQDSLESLEAAYRMFPDGKRTSSILIDKSLCMMMFNRDDEAFHLARQVQEREHGELKTLAMQYMAECDLALGRPSDALKLYSEIETRLPCRLVQEERIKTGIKNAMAFLEKPSSKRNVVQ
jgi:tetratricopeptide (TPR) repeat protein